MNNFFYYTGFIFWGSLVFASTAFLIALIWHWCVVMPINAYRFKSALKSLATHQLYVLADKVRYYGKIRRSIYWRILYTEFKGRGESDTDIKRGIGNLSVYWPTGAQDE